MADEEQNPDELAEGEGKSGKKKLIIIAAAVVLLLAIGGGVAAFFLMSDEESVEEVEAEGPVVPEIEALYTKVRTLEGKPMFVVSLESEDDGKLHYMQLYVEAKSRDPAVDEALQLHMPLIVARLNAHFSSQSIQTLMKASGKRAMQQQATEIVKEILQDKIGQPGIESILFTNMVMQ